MIPDDMANRESAFIEITPEVLLKAYACGIFPMAESAEDPSLYWIEPDLRGIIPLDRFYVSSRLARTVRSDQFKITVNRDFDGVIDGCAEPQTGRPRTWINERIRTLYRKLYERRHCHSIEVYLDDDLVGGLYGVALGRAFFGESMFHRSRDASKVALVHLVARLKAGGFTLLDTQFVTDHLKSFGAIEVPRRQYHKLLESALSGEGDFTALDKRGATGAQVLAQLSANYRNSGIGLLRRPRQLLRRRVAWRLLLHLLLLRLRRFGCGCARGGGSVRRAFGGDDLACRRGSRSATDRRSDARPRAGPGSTRTSSR